MKTLFLITFGLLTSAHLSISAQDYQTILNMKMEILEAYHSLHIAKPDIEKDFTIFKPHEKEIVYIVASNPENKSGTTSLFIFKKKKENWIKEHQFIAFNQNTIKEKNGHSVTKDNINITPYDKGFVVTCEASMGDNRDYKQWLEVYLFTNNTLKFVGNFDFYEFHQSDIYPVKKVNYNGSYRFNVVDKKDPPLIIIKRIFTQDDRTNKQIYRFDAGRYKYIKCQSGALSLID